MRRISSGWIILGLAALTIFAACGGGGGDAQLEARQARLDELRQAKSSLDAMREELAANEARLAELTASETEGADDAAEGEGEGEGEAVVEDPAALAASIQQLEAAVIEATDQLGSDLVGFINEDPPVVGQPMSEIQQAAMSMKSEEDIVLAQTYIDEGGDYSRAIRIYEDALAADPNSAHLKEALARAQELRYMTPERFAAAQKGMTQAEVRSTLGQVNHRNVREYPDREVVAWFYPTGEGGAAAGVFFRKERRSEDFVVYQTDFEAVKPRGPDGEPIE
jgi:hypothetical protein